VVVAIMMLAVMVVVIMMVAIITTKGGRCTRDLEADPVELVPVTWGKRVEYFGRESCTDFE